ncbi:unnamed protein product [Tuber aestivum]|uniref:Uncharacterized protein n=1 Tax=Tuber aestivum TaxID=59557 RepID=A0A292Q5A7_9PEZI|nr:unnamed protein product [Tuber aestivum]
MFTFLRIQAVKSVSRTTLGLGLLSSPACRMHSPASKYLRPLCYEYKSVRRLASQTILHDVRAHKAGQEASQRSQPVDTRDPHGPGCKDYDTLIPDIDVRKLKSRIAGVAGIPYHSPATREEADAVVKIGDCFLYGPNLRIFFPAILSSPEGKAHWVFFLVNSGTSRTYLSTQTSDLFGITPSDVSAAVAIAGHHHTVYRAPQHSHFAEVDILGTHFLNAHGASLITDFAALRAKLFFGGTAWKVMVEGAKL